MKKLLVFLCAMSLVFGMMGMAGAASISYEGELLSGSTVTGSVSGGGWYNEIASETDFWNFYGISGDVVDILGLRLDTDLDPAFTLYSGVTTADETEFNPWGDFGGMTYLTYADDEISNTGPYGDPFLDDYVLPNTGLYTVAIGGYYSDGVGPYDYELTITGNSPIPEPATMLLLGSGLIGLAGLGRKKFFKKS